MSPSNYSNGANTAGNLGGTRPRGARGAPGAPRPNQDDFDGNPIRVVYPRTNGKGVVLLERFRAPSSPPSAIKIILMGKSPRQYPEVLRSTVPPNRSPLTRSDGELSPTTNQISGHERRFLRANALASAVRLLTNTARTTRRYRSTVCTIPTREAIDQIPGPTNDGAVGQRSHERAASIPLVVRCDGSSRSNHCL